MSAHFTLASEPFAPHFPHFPMPPRTCARSALPELEESSPGLGAPTSPTWEDGPLSDPSVGDVDDALSALDKSRDTFSHISWLEAAAAAENLLEIALCPPSDEHGGSVSLLTPSHPRAVVRPLSVGSPDVSPAAALPKRHRKQAPSPVPSSTVPGPSRITLTIPPRQHIPSIAEHIAEAVLAPVSPLLEEMACTAIADGAGHVDYSDLRVRSTIKTLFSHFAPGLDVDALLPQPAQGTTLCQPVTCLTLPAACHCLTIYLHLTCCRYLTHSPLPYLLPFLTYLPLPYPLPSPYLLLSPHPLLTFISLACSFIFALLSWALFPLLHLCVCAHFFISC